MSFGNKLRAGLPLIFSVTALITPVAPFAQELVYLEEIIVTAQKREQNIQDVPLAVTALSGGQLVEHGITDIFDLQQTAPGLIVDQSQTATTANFSIRGVGTSSQNFGLESSVGLYVDGVYRARQSSMINELVDIDRLEVLRGPQGTLFGRNTSSGAVLVHTVGPDHEGSGYLEATYGNIELVSVNGAFSASLIKDILAVRVTGFTTDRNGFIDTVNLGTGVANDRNRQGGRAQLLYTPSENLSVRLILDYSEIDEICCSAGTVRNNYFSFSGQPGSDALLASLGIPLLGGDRFYDDIVDVNTLPVSKNDDKGVSAELNWDIGPGTVTSITGLRSFDTTDDIDADFSGADLFYRLNRGESDTFSQELRFAGGSDRLNYLGGMYYFTQDLESRRGTTLGSDAAAFILGPVEELTALVDGLNALSLATGGQLPMVADPIPPGSSSRDVMVQEHEAWAVFGQFDLQLTDQWQLSAGMRYTDENKSINGTFTQDGPALLPDFSAIGTHLFLVRLGLAAPDPVVLAPLYQPGWGIGTIRNEAPDFDPRPNLDETLKDNQVTMNVKLSWFPQDDIMLYGGYATGFKSGGTNADRLPVTLSQLFDAEKTKSFEIGTKATFPRYNLRTNLAVHYTIIEDYQTAAFTGTTFNLQNAAELDTRGGELEVTWAPTNSLSLSGAYIYNEAEFEEFQRGNCWVATPFQTGQPDPGRRNPGDTFCDRSGDRVFTNPKHTIILSATQSYSFTDNVMGYVHADYNYRSNTITDRNGDPLKRQGGFGLLNLRAGMVLEHFDLDIALWARNVLDEDYHGAMFDAPLQSGKLVAYPREPRTYGVTVRKIF